jgi:hypothetical protein
VRRIVRWCCATGDGFAFRHLTCHLAELYDVPENGRGSKAEASSPECAERSRKYSIQSSQVFRR